MSDIIPFPKNKKEKENTEIAKISSEDIEIIGFLTFDDRSVGIKNRKDIKAVMLFIKKMKIEILEYV